MSMMNELLKSTNLKSKNGSSPPRRSGKEKQMEANDMKTMRDALTRVREMAASYINCHDDEIDGVMTGIVAACNSALAAPPRNCDLPLVVDGPADNNADKVWWVFKQAHPDAYFDVPGLLRCIEWLLAPAKKRKGEGDENE